MTDSLNTTDPNGYGIEVLYGLRREVWAGDIDATLNYAERLPTEGDAALVESRTTCRCSASRSHAFTPATRRPHR